MTQLCKVLDAILPIDVDPLAPPTEGNNAPMGIGSAVLESYFLVAIYRSLGAALIEESQVCILCNWYTLVIII